MKQHIALYDVMATPLWKPAGHVLYPHGRWAWLHRLLWRALERMGAVKDHLQETTSYRRVLIDEDRLFDRIHRTLDAIYSRYQKPSEVLMGPETFSELMAAPEARDYMGAFSFTTEGRKLMGLRVHVLPWMEGLLVR